MPKLKEIVEAQNVAKLLSKELLDKIGQEAVTGYNVDRASRAEWEERQADAVKLALQVSETKSFPWENCSNVKFPLVTIAALQFLSRVAILTKGRQLVKCDVLGPDETGQLAARGSRIASHMSFQLVEEDKNWIDDDEKAKLAASIIGCAFKKSFFDPIRGINISEHVPAMDFVVDYMTKSLEKSNRMTQLMRFNANDVRERVAGGLWLEMNTDRSTYPESNVMKAAADETAGVHSSLDTSIDSYDILEQHCFWDLDEDGYQEPYIIWVRRDTAQVLRIVARFFDAGDVYRKNDLAIRRLRRRSDSFTDEGKTKADKQIKELEDAKDNSIVRIEGFQHFTKIPFIPSPDGGFYDLGLGALLGPINESTNSIINQLIDAGTMSNTAGGFLGRGVKLKGGKQSFDPFEWKPVDSTGDDLRKNIFPLPVREPSAVLFQLLSLLITYGEKISGSTDIMTGVSPGQNTPAETSRNTIEQGMKLFSGIYARMHRAFKRELEVLYQLNRMFLDMNTRYIQLTAGDSAIITAKDYQADGALIFPAADPATVSETQRQQKAIMMKQAAAESPGYNRYEVEKMFLEAFEIPNWETLYPNPQGPKAIPVPPNPKVELEKQKLQLQAQDMQQQFQLAFANLQVEAGLAEAKIKESAAKEQKLLAEAAGADVSQQIAAINAQTGAARAHHDGLVQAMNILQRTIDQQHASRKLDLEEKQAAVAAKQQSTKKEGK